MTITSGWELKLKIRCFHGYFEFEELRAGEVSDFASYFGLDMVRQRGRFFTFKKLLNAPEYSLKGSNYFLNTLGRVSFEGGIGDVFEANGWVYDFDTGLLTPIAGVTTQVQVDQAGNYFLSDGLIKAGSVTQTRERIKSYSAWFSIDTLKFKYTEMTFV